MRDLAILTFITLDGVMQAPKLPEEDRTNGFSAGGWADPYWEPVMRHVTREAMSQPYDLLLGRNTYNAFAENHPADPTHPMTAATKYVVTSSPDTLAWTNAVALRGDVVDAVARLKSEPGPLLQVHGSWRLIQTLIAEDLVDEFRLWTFPVVVGAGKRLFATGLPPRALTLRASTPAERSGVVMNIYRRQAS